MEFELLIPLLFFAVGMYGVVANRDLIRIFISLSIMLASVALVIASVKTPQSSSFVLFIWIIEVLEIIIALSLFIYLKKKGVTNLNELGEYRG